MAIVLSRGTMSGAGSSGGLHVLTRDGRIEPVGAASEAAVVPLGAVRRRTPGPSMFPSAEPEPAPEPDPLAGLDSTERAAVLEFVKHYIAGYCGPYHALNTRRSA